MLYVVQERGGTTVKGVGGAVREGEVAPRRDEVDDDDGLDFEVQSCPDSVARSEPRGSVKQCSNKTMARAEEEDSRSEPDCAETKDDHTTRLGRLEHIQHGSGPVRRRRSRLPPFVRF